ncbi:MAG: hypothetical protein HW406_83 [Candidatus Brocadiaceae bacterium]|nr:hypothetical protein [Candidatus Brocadiaceae bacterium]
MKKITVFTAVSLFQVFLSAGITRAAEIDINEVIWKTTHNKVDSKSERRLILGGVDGTIYILSDKGEVLIKRNLEGISSDIVSADIDNTPGDEIIASVMDKEGNIVLLDGKMNTVWKYNDARTFLAVGAGDVNNDGVKEIVGGTSSGEVYALSNKGKFIWKKSISGESSISAIAVGNVDGVSGDEIIVGTRQEGIYFLGGTGNVIRHVKPALKEADGKHNTRILWIRNIQINDINNDGKNEIVVGSRPSGMITVLNGRGELVWSTNFPDIVNSWSNAQISIGNLTGDEGKEIICLLHGIVTGANGNTTPIMTLNSQGKIVSKIFPVASYLTIDTIPSGSGYDQVLLGTPTRSTKLLLTELKDLPDSLSKRQVTKTDERTGELHSKITNRSSSVSAVKGAGRKIHVLQHVAFSDGLNEMERLYRFLKTRESDRLAFEIMIDGLREMPSGEKVKGGKGKKDEKEGRETVKAAKKKDKKERDEDTDDYDVPERFQGKGSYSQSDILSFVSEMEQKNIPFYIRVAKNNNLHLSLQTVEKILVTAPRSCRGFIANECSYTRRGFDRFVTSMGKVMDLLVKYGEKKLILNEHFDFWFEMPSDYSIASRIFKPAFKNVIIPMYKTNRPHIPELNLGMIMGLWKSGVCSEWGYSAQEDVWKWESIFLSRSSDVLLRMEVMAASLGATYFRIEGNGEFVKKEKGNYALDPDSIRHRDLFHTLVRKGVIIPPDRSEQVLTSPVLFQKEFNPQQKPKDSEGHHAYWIRKFAQRGLFSYEFPLKRAKDDYLPALWTGMLSYYEGLLPKTPYGFVSFVPQWVKPDSQTWASRFVVKENGSIMDSEGRKIPQGDEKKVILESLKKYGNQLPFSADNVVLSVNKSDDGNYLLYLIDPNQFNVRDITTKLKINMKESIAKVEDVIENKPLNINNSEIQVTVPAGLFKVVRVVTVAKK